MPAPCAQLPPDTPDLAPADGMPPALSAPSEALKNWTAWHTLTDSLEPVLCEPRAQHDARAQIERASRLVMQLTRDDPDLAIFFMVHDTPEKLQRYGVLHAVHTAMLLAVVGRRRDWSPQLTLSAVAAGLTMNLSVTQLQSELARQGEPLTQAQRARIQAHPQDSHALLQSLGVSDEEWLTAVLQHHEQADGRGYPTGIASTHLLADAVRTCDIYAAKMSPRVGRSVMQAPKAATQIFRERSANYFGATLTREMGLYPPGTLVLLHDGRLAVVVRRGRDLSLPEVVALSHTDEAVWHASERLVTEDRGVHVATASEEADWGTRIRPQELLALC